MHMRDFIAHISTMANGLVLRLPLQFMTALQLPKILLKNKLCCLCYALPVF